MVEEATLKVELPPAAEVSTILLLVLFWLEGVRLPQAALLLDLSARRLPRFSSEVTTIPEASLENEKEGSY